MSSEHGWINIMQTWNSNLPNTSALFYMGSWVKAPDSQALGHVHVHMEVVQVELLRNLQV